MATERRQDIWSIVAATDGETLAERICRACAQIVAVTGAAMVLIGNDGQRGLVHGTDAIARRLEDMQLTLGEGPCVDAFHRRGPVLARSLLQEPDRWPVFGQQAIELGVSAVFSFPLQVGAAQLGVLDLYRVTPGDLSGDRLADALIFADLGTEALFAPESEDPNGVQINLDGVDTHAEMYQASGMVMVQLGIGPAEALARLRAYAYAHDLLVTEVARQVIFQDLQLEGDEHEHRSPGVG